MSIQNLSFHLSRARAAIQKGSGGGPIYDGNGNIIGVVISPGKEFHCDRSVIKTKLI